MCLYCMPMHVHARNIECEHFVYFSTNAYGCVCLGVSVITNERVGERLCVSMKGGVHCVL